ncbi:MAG: LPS-assembly protein LptD, partial [Phocaeicola sp.]|nr:LPS-assembly protein LptD [Phocaeicola sp.]
MTSLRKSTYLFFLLIVITLGFSVYAEAQRPRRPASGRTKAGVADTLQKDSVPADSVATDSVAVKKQAIDAPIQYEANDSIVFTQGGYAHLFGQGKVNYQRIELQADAITMNMDSSTVYARGVADTAGVVSGTPIFKDGDTPYESQIMRYNFKTKKGFINDIVTQQGEGYVVSKE